MNFLNELVSLSRDEMVDEYNKTNRDPIENVKFDKRAASSFSASRKATRHKITDKLFPDGFNEFDLHSAGIAIQRLMNTGEFDPDYDIKDDIEKLTGADRDLIKAVLVKSQYHIDKENVKGSVERNYPHLDISQFDDIYEVFTDIIGPNHGDTSLYGIEAEIELLTCIALRKMGYHTSNVYDNFYSEASEAQIKETLIKVAKAYYQSKQHKLEESFKLRIQNLREGKTSTMHLEDSIIRGPATMNKMIEFFNYLYGLLEGTYTGDNPPISQKIDGGPVIFMWSSFPGLPGPGCAGKGLLNKTPVHYTTHEQIDADDKPQGYKDKLHYVLKLAQAVKIPANQVWMGDMLFSKGDAKTYEQDGEKFVYVKPVTIAYAAPFDSDIGKKFLNCEVGAVFHTRFRDNLTNKTNDISISELGDIPDWAFVKDAQINNLSGKVSFNKQESAFVKREIDKLKKLVNELNNNEAYHELTKNQKFIDSYVTTLQNNKIDRQSKIDPNEFVNELVSWIGTKMDNNRSKLDSLKTEAGRIKKAASLDTTQKELNYLVTNNKDVIQKIATCLKLATDIKEYMVEKINEADEWISQIETKDGFSKTGGEGFIASDVDGDFVKLVDRAAFTYFARSPDIIKGGAHSASRENTEKKTAVVNFGRLNPVSIGHRKMAEAIRAKADELGGEAFIYLSHSYDGVDSKKFKKGTTKNPLKYEDKITFVQDAIGDIVTVVNSKADQAFAVYGELYRKGFTDLVIIAGEDRIEVFERDAQNHNGKYDAEPMRCFDFDSIKAVNAGVRDEDSDDEAEQASASLLRRAVSDNDFETFEKFVGAKSYAQEMFDLLKYEMGLSEKLKENEELTIDELINRLDNEDNNIEIEIDVNPDPNEETNFNIIEEPENKNEVNDSTENRESSPEEISSEINSAIDSYMNESINIFNKIFYKSLKEETKRGKTYTVKGKENIKKVLFNIKKRHKDLTFYNAKHLGGGKWEIKTSYAKSRSNLSNREIEWNDFDIEEEAISEKQIKGSLLNKIALYLENKINYKDTPEKEYIRFSFKISPKGSGQLKIGFNFKGSGNKALIGNRINKDKIKDLIDEINISQDNEKVICTGNITNFIVYQKGDTQIDFKYHPSDQAINESGASKIVNETDIQEALFAYILSRYNEVRSGKLNIENILNFNNFDNILIDHFNSEEEFNNFFAPKSTTGKEFSQYGTDGKNWVFFFNTLINEIKSDEFLNKIKDCYNNKIKNQIDLNQYKVYHPNLKNSENQKHDFLIRQFGATQGSFFKDTINPTDVILYKDLKEFDLLYKSLDNVDEYKKNWNKHIENLNIIGLSLKKNTKSNLKIYRTNPEPIGTSKAFDEKRLVCFRFNNENPEVCTVKINEKTINKNYSLMRNKNDIPTGIMIEIPVDEKHIHMNAIGLTFRSSLGNDKLKPGIKVGLDFRQKGGSPEAQLGRASDSLEYLFKNNRKAYDECSTLISVDDNGWNNIKNNFIKNLSLLGDKNLKLNITKLLAFGCKYAILFVDSNGNIDKNRPSESLAVDYIKIS